MNCRISTSREEDGNVTAQVQAQEVNLDKDTFYKLNVSPHYGTLTRMTSKKPRESAQFQGVLTPKVTQVSPCPYKTLRVSSFLNFVFATLKYVLRHLRYLKISSEGIIKRNGRHVPEHETFTLNLKIFVLRCLIW